METYTRTYSYKLDWQANASKLVALDALYKGTRLLAISKKSRATYAVVVCLI